MWNLNLCAVLFLGQECIEMKPDEKSRKTHTVCYQPNSCDNKVEVRHFPKGIFLEFSCCSTDFTTHDLFIIFYHVLKQRHTYTLANSGFF